MLNIFFKFIKKIIISTLLIYSFDVFSVSFHFSIPINFYTVILVSFFDIPAFVGLILFSLTF